MTPIAPTTTTRYAETTASMLPGLEAPPDEGRASESSLKDFPIDSARCATYPGELEWIPDQEQSVVPAPMAALCRRCPGRDSCLLWALRVGEPGYWAGTTSADRRAMVASANISTRAADNLQLQARQKYQEGALHPYGEGSFSWYRRSGCRCGECRAANAAARAAERTAARSRQAA